VRKHGAREGEAAKVSWLRFDALASSAGFEQGLSPCSLGL